MEMNISKKDEGIIMLADINVNTTIDYISKLIDIKLTDEEIEYYVQHHKPNPVQIDLVCNYYSRFFGGYRDLNLLDRHQYIKLLLLLKKKLILEAGSKLNSPDSFEQVCLPFVLTANINDKVNNRIIRNNKFISTLEDDSNYQDLVNNKYKNMCQLNPDFIKSKISPFLNTTFTYVVYEDPSLLGKEISYADNKISSEILLFLKNI